MLTRRSGCISSIHRYLYVEKRGKERGPRKELEIYRDTQMKEEILKAIGESARLHEDLASLAQVIEEAALAVIDAVRGGGRIYVFGNGGSAADAQHIAAELVGRFEKERRAFPVMALSCNTSILTALGNDYDFSDIFARQVEAFARPGDLAMGISTSGNSPNVIKGLLRAREAGARTIALLGKDGGQMRDLADITIIVPHRRTARIQEGHITIAHILCDLVEGALA
jgi:D-sedoheptulose 7-phosphate isomerase